MIVYIVYDDICRTDPHVRCLEVTCDMPVLVSDDVWCLICVVCGVGVVQCLVTCQCQPMLSGRFAAN